MPEFVDMRSKAPLINGVFNGGKEDRLAKFDQEHDRKYNGDKVAPEKIILEIKRPWDSLRKMVDTLGANDDFLQLFVKSPEEKAKNQAADYLIRYRETALGGILCCEIHEVTADFMEDLSKRPEVSGSVAASIKKMELGAKQQMAKGLLAAIKAMKKDGHEEYRTSGGTPYVLLDMLRKAKNLAGYCTSARTIYGDSCWNVYAGYASSKMLAQILLILGDETQAFLVFGKTLRLYREANPERQPEDDDAMKDLFIDFGMSTQSNLVPLLDTSSTETQEAPTADESTNDRCAVCMHEQVDVMYMQCKHLCICYRCSETARQHEIDNLVVCPICRSPSTRERVFLSGAARD
jgi:hypothetical protein